MGRVSLFLRECHLRNPLLFFAAVGNVVLFIAFAIVSLFDFRALAGVSVWMKPMKFALSFAIFLLTFAYMLAYLPGGMARRISIGIFACMVAEMLCIASQAARGVPSHFNTGTPYDAVVFLVMGIFIFLNTVISLYCIFVFWNVSSIPNPVLRQAWSFGLIIFFLGSISGGMMIGIGGHQIGGKETSDTIPFLNWAVAGGDLRSAHFFTLHALQLVPLTAMLAQRVIKQARVSVALTVILYGGFCAMLHWIAWQGKPFWYFPEV